MQTATRLALPQNLIQHLPNLEMCEINEGWHGSLTTGTKLCVGTVIGYPGGEFYDDADPEGFMPAVISERVRGSVRMWFQGDSEAALCRGCLESWHAYYVSPDDYADAGN